MIPSTIVYFSDNFKSEFFKQVSIGIELALGTHVETSHVADVHLVYANKYLTIFNLEKINYISIKFIENQLYNYKISIKSTI